jgi:hypothetical protein
VPNQTHYNGSKRSSATIRGPDTVEHHVNRIIEHTRRLLSLDGTIEQALDLVLEAARREFQCRVLAIKPTCIRIDGYDYTWPIISGSAKKPIAFEDISNRLRGGR